MSSGRQQQQQQQQQPSQSASAPTSTSSPSPAQPPQQNQSRTATPSLGSSEWAIGHNLQITTTTGQVHTGILLIHDPISQVIVLTQSRSVNGIDLSPSNSLVDFQIVRISSIKDIRVLGTRQEGFKPYEAKPITIQDIKAREELAQKRALAEEKRLGVGVSSEGQKIYDAFERTLPVKWVDKSIMVADQALINPPYTVESVISVSAALNGSSEDEKTTLLTRIKHVLEQERAKLGLNATAKAPPQGRKGG